MKNIKTLADVTRIHAQEKGDASALLSADDGREWTYAELDKQANLVANALVDAGIRPGDRIAYLDRNAPEYFIFLFGGAKVNAVSVAVNWRLANEEMEYILNHSEATVLLIGEEYLPALREMNLSAIESVVVIGDPGESGHPTFDQWLVGRAVTDPNVQILPEDTCYQLYTSGTTGLPKGVELTHSNFMHCMRDSLVATKMTGDSVNLICMPLFHISGSGWGVVGLFNGARSILLRDVDLGAILRLIPQFGITHSLFVPAVLQFLLAEEACRETDLSSLQSIVYGASPITEAVLIDAMQTFGCEFVQVYGLTETTGGISVLEHSDHDPEGSRSHLLRSCGKAISTHNIKILDQDSGEEMPEGEVGEICVTGPQVMKSYWKNEKATNDSFINGWFRTGDAGYLNDGYLYIHDRVKDMVISGGENIYPAEIENVLMRHPLVSDCAVIGVPSDRWGETVKAIVTRTDESLSEKVLIEHCRKSLAGYKCPTSVDWMAEIPRNPSGKILKVELRKPYWQGKSRHVS